MKTVPFFLLRRLAVPMVACLLKVMRRSVRWRLRLHHANGQTELLPLRFVPPAPNAIYATWHNRLLFIAAVFAHTGLCALISRSQDGELIAAVVKRLGFQVVRGSSSRGGASALKTFWKNAHGQEQAQTIAVTLDGPRGPRYQAQAGALWLSQTLQLPICPVSFSCDRYWQVNSWDGLIIPKWGSTVIVDILPLMQVPHETHSTSDADSGQALHSSKSRRALRQAQQRLQELLLTVPERLISEGE